ncbi:MAG: adenylate/guanylate cyclase domain-containing protein [Alkalispirochaetaceae bacterium]
MKVRWKIVAVVLPLLAVTIVLTGASAVFSSTRGITRIAQEFLGFKATELQKHANSQWALLVENGFTEREDMVAATQSGIISFAASLMRNESELIIATDANGRLVGSTLPRLELSEQERARLSQLYAEEPPGMVDITIGGVERVATGFLFEPFDYFYLVTDERAAFYRDVERIIRESGVILVIALTASIALLFLLSQQLTNPIGRIVGTMRTIIESSDMGSRVPVEYKDETGELAHTFNIMIGELDKAYAQIKNYAFKAVLSQKKEYKIRNIFQKYVPQELIDRFFENPEGMLVGENRELSVLFSDIRSFTSISEAMEPDDLVDSLNRYFSVMVDIIMSRNGVIDKYIGDAIMAFFGAPVSHEDDPLQSVLAGVEMTEGLHKFNEKQRELGKPEFKIGVGINYGTVTVGNIGTERKMDYTVIGDMVNLASRLEGLTKKYGEQLIIAESLFDHIKDELPWRLLDTVAVKGKTRGVRIYTVRRSLDEATSEAWRLHNEGMSLYYNRRFDEAATLFDRAAEALPGDRGAATMAERSRRYIGTPPPEQWDGVEIMTEK